MSRDAAIQYLYDNRHAGSEWQEAGMWHAVCEVIQAGQEAFESEVACKAWLDKLLGDAKNN